MEEEKIIEELAQLPAEPEKSEAELELMRLEPVLSALKKLYGEDWSPEAVALLLLRGLKKEREDSRRFCRHLEKLIAEAEELKKSVPGFELMEALEDAELLKLSAPHTGLSLSQAYHALHYSELEKAAARESLEKLSRSIRSGGARPRESAGGKAAEPAKSGGSMSRRQREELKRRIYEAAALGDKVFP